MKRALMIIGVWSLLALLFSTQISLDAAYSGHPLRWSQALILAFAGWYGWALLSPLVIAIARRVRLSWGGIAIHAVLSIVMTAIKIAATTELLRRAGFSQRALSLIVNLPVNIVTYWAIVGATWAIETQLRASRLETSLAEARLEILRNQIHPHFLFNTLHSISELMHEDVDAADRMLTRLSDLLRASLESAGQQEVPLRQELGTVERYLDIERVRLGDRLRVAIEVDPAALDVPVPNFILQPLVENAIRHAVARRTEGGNVFIRARVQPDGLHLEVEDDGPGFSADQPLGIGLSNVRDRIAGNMRMERGARGGALVRLVV